MIKFIFKPIPPRREIFDSYLNNGSTTLIFSDILKIYLSNIWSKNVLKILLNKSSQVSYLTHFTKLFFLY